MQITKSSGKRSWDTFRSFIDENVYHLIWMNPVKSLPCKPIGNRLWQHSAPRAAVLHKVSGAQFGNRSK